MNFKKLDEKINERCDAMIFEFPSKIERINSYRDLALKRSAELKKVFMNLAQDAKNYLNHEMRELLKDVTERD